MTYTEVSRIRGNLHLLNQSRLWIMCVCVASNGLGLGRVCVAQAGCGRLASLGELVRLRGKRLYLARDWKGRRKGAVAM